MAGRRSLFRETTDIPDIEYDVSLLSLYFPVIRREDVFLVQNSMEISRTILHESVTEAVGALSCLSFVSIINSISDDAS